MELWKGIVEKTYLQISDGQAVESISMDASLSTPQDSFVKTANNECDTRVVIVCIGSILPTAFFKNIGINVDTKFSTA